MAKAWFPFYFSDYTAKTEHLSLAEHGAYLLLMGSYYKTGCKLPANAMQLQRICRAFAVAEIDAMNSVLDQFFEKHSDGYYHTRIDAELAKSNEISKKRSEAAQKRYKKDANRVQTGCKPDANAETLQPHLQTQSQSQSQLQPQSQSYSSEFESGWKKYPRRSGTNDKKKSFRAWNARLTEAHTPDVMIAGIERYSAYCVATGKTGTEFVMHAATFFGPADPPHFLNPWAMEKNNETHQKPNAVSRVDAANPGGCYEQGKTIEH